MLVMVVFFIAFRWIHLSTPLIRLFLLVLILLLMPTLNFLPVWFALSLLRFRLPSRLPMRSEERFSRNAETDLVCRLLLEKKKTVIRAYRDVKIDVLVSTTLLELAMDLPHATFILLDHPSRFGL